MTPQAHHEPLNTASARNEFSGSTFQMINFIVDYPVRLPDSTPEALGRELGRVVYVQVELQLVDAQTHQSNEAGENAHYKYKARQFRSVRNRLFPEGLDEDAKRE